MAQSLTFGVFPLGLAGSADGVAAGPPDDVEQIVGALQDLEGDGPPLLARMYVSWTGAASTALAAADAKRDSGATAAIGFAVTPEVNPAGGAFWPAVAQPGGSAFADAADYAGLDMYPDVFGPPVALDRLEGAVDWLLRSFRDEVLPIAGIGPGTPIRICENGWPTGPGRTPERQADVLETILRAVHARREELNVTHWELFTLRDADSARDGLFYQFGVLRDDYSPKPAFERLCSLFRELR